MNVADVKQDEAGLNQGLVAVFLVLCWQHGSSAVNSHGLSVFFAALGDIAVCALYSLCCCRASNRC